MKKMNIKPDNLSAAKGNSKGEINLQWDSVENAVSYIIEIASYVNSKNLRWKTVDIISDPHYTIRNLRSNKKYLFRIASADKEGRKEISSDIEKTAP